MRLGQPVGSKFTMVLYGQYHFFEWIYEVGQETGLKFVHQNSRIVPFDKTPTQSTGNLKKVNSAPHKLLVGNGYKLSAQRFLGMGGQALHMIV